MSELVLRNRQRVRRLNTPLLRRIIRSLLAESVGDGDYELCFHIVAAPEMARINEQFLQHSGSTDVITFDYSEAVNDSPAAGQRTKAGVKVSLHGEIFICLADAVTQAREFGTTWQSELVRYVVHGVLHLLGHDDLKPAARRKMKREENRLLSELAARFALSQLGKTSKLVR